MRQCGAESAFLTLLGQLSVCRHHRPAQHQRCCRREHRRPDVHLCEQHRCVQQHRPGGQCRHAHTAEHGAGTAGDVRYRRTQQHDHRDFRPDVQPLVETALEDRVYDVGVHDHARRALVDGRWGEIRRAGGNSVPRPRRNGHLVHANVGGPNKKRAQPGWRQAADRLPPRRRGREAHGRGRGSHALAARCQDAAGSQVRIRSEGNECGLRRSGDVDRKDSTVAQELGRLLRPASGRLQAQLVIGCAALPLSAAALLPLLALAWDMAGLEGGLSGLARYLLKTGRKIESPMLIANGKNMRNDVVISLSVLIGLVFTINLKMPIIDSAFALLISIWIMKSGFDIFMETNVELMDGVSDQSIYRKIFESVDQAEGANNPHRVRVRKLANMYIIGIDIEVDPDLQIGEAHKIARDLEQLLKKRIGNVYDIMVHVEPLGNYEVDELYGISSKDIETKPD